MSLKVVESTYTSPILIVDREGGIGLPLSEEIEKNHLTMVVSSKEPAVKKNIISVPFKKKIPVIPDNVFSHIFIVYRGEKELLKALPSFIQKAKQSRGRFIFISDIFHYKDSFLTGFKKQYDQVQVLLVGDVFKKDGEGESPINTLLTTAKTHGRLRLSNSGLDTLYPVAMEDVVEGIVASVFAVPKDGGIYAIFPMQPATELTIARDLQKKYPLLHIDFIAQKKQRPQIHLPEDLIPVFGSTYPLEARLGQVDLAHTALAAPETKKSRQKSSFPKARFPRVQKLFIPLLILVFLFVLPFIISFGFAFAGGLFLLQAQSQIGGKGLEAAANTAKTSVSMFSIADTSAGVIRSVIGSVGVGEGVVGFQSTIHSGKLIADAMEEGLQGGIIMQRVLADKESDPKKSFLQASDKLKNSFGLIQSLQAEKKLPPQIADKLAMYQKPISLILNTIDTYPSLLGFEGKKKYLVLFLNNAELRSGGGFIGSFAIADVHNAKLEAFKVYDVYDADGQMKIKIDPPYEFLRYLGSSNLFLRDSNFAIDFPTGAEEVARMLNLELGEKVDGVVAMDATFLSEVIGINGTLSVPDYKETLTKDNFYLKTQTYAQKDFFPGSTQKKDFLRSVQNQLLTDLSHGKISQEKLLLLLSDMTEQKHLLFAFPDPSIQKLFTVNNLSSSVVERRDTESSKSLDFLHVNEENLGQNKANYSLKRSIDHNVIIDGEGEISEKVQIDYDNQSKKDDPFGGEYKAYVRLIVPIDASLKEVLIDKVPQNIIPAVTNPKLYLARNFRPAQGIEIEEKIESGRKVFGFFLQVPNVSKKSVTFSYSLAKKAAVSAGKFNYDLIVFKQPGTLKDPYKLTVSYPMDVKLYESNLAASDLGGKVVLETNLATDRNILLTFANR